MAEKRIQFNNVIQNQLPSYVKEEFPLVAEFLKQYYISQEFQGASTDLIQNIDNYIKLNSIKNNSEFTTLDSEVSLLDDTIFVTSTVGFPDSYGLLQIDDEIITYTGKTSESFTGCVRGFSGVTSYNTENKPDQLVFTTSLSEDHSLTTQDGELTKVFNLSSLFLKEFFNKLKYQLSPGFENRSFYENLDKYLFLKQSKDFYSTRGTDISYKILFKVLYGEDVKVIKPQECLVKPSDAQYNITNDLVVESISGNPYELINSTLFQDEYEDISKGYAPISNVEMVFSDSDKEYYKLSFDSGYNKDINVEGSLYGNFSSHPKTKLIGSVTPNSKCLDVDSTVGFPSEGELSVTYTDGSEGVIFYSSKNLNQFLGCTNIIGNILDESNIWLNVYAYGQSNKNENEIVKVRITSVLKDVDIEDNNFYQIRGTKGIIRTLGVNKKDSKLNDWFLNISTKIDTFSPQLIDNTDKTYRLRTKIDHNLKVGDKIKVISNNGEEKYSTVIKIVSRSIIEIRDQGSLNVNESYTIQRLLLKANSSNYPLLSDQISNVQNIYRDKEKTLISSPSIPYYNNQPLNVSDRSVIFSGTFSGDSFTITSSDDHGFYTGDSVYYSAIDGDGSLFEDGIYYVKRINPNAIKLARSRSNLYNSIFVNVDYPTTVTNNKFVQSDLYNHQLESQKILREINPPINDGKIYSTDPGPIGILVNGVEILNYKSKDKVYYGPIETIDVVSPGFGYDVINPPSLIISDSVGAGATGYCSVKGSLQEIRIIDPGFDYIEIPKININGGNGYGAKANASMKLIDHQVIFSSEQKSAFVNIPNSTIGFSTYHKFRNAEKIIYKTQGQKGVGGLSTNSSYYVSVQDLYTVKVHRTFDDALSGINTIAITSYGIGNHIIESYNKKSVLSSINIENSGEDYENKKRTAKSAGISTSMGTIQIKNHGFKSGEIVKYTNTTGVIGGLSNNSNYYVTRIDNDIFKLSNVGINTDNKDFYFRTNQYVEFSSVGSGVHTFNYPDIIVEVQGNIGISSIFKAQVQPIFRGEITSVHLESNGVGYGSSEIINFDRSPTVELNRGSDSQLVPIINNGKISEVLINNPGKNYESAPNLSILSNNIGGGAVLTPIIEDNQIKSVKIIESGGGYDPNSVSINVTYPGVGAQFKVNLKTWNINLFSKHFKNITNDDGFICKNKNSIYGLQYTHLYAPRKLRESVYAKDLSGIVLYGVPDLKKVNNNEINSYNHSPIIGWAYDGNPIYGPYGYSKKDGGFVTKMKSGYKINLQSNRPLQSAFPVGFFVEDYEYKNSDDDSVLDEYNGRFCVTPDFPNGVYAYFATISDNSSNEGPFTGYRSPVFPYLIGNKFKSLPNEFNFKQTSNQDSIDLNKTNWNRDTTLYNLLEKNASYPYISLPNNLNQTVDIKFASPGYIDSVGIITGGSNYQVNDRIVFDEEGTNGFGFSSKVSRIKGKQINSVSASSTSFYDSKIYSLEGNKGVFVVETTSAHNLRNKDIITLSGISTTNSLLEGNYNIQVDTNTFAVSNKSGIGTVGSTGIVTYISVSGNLAYLNIKENDIFILNNEKIKILNVDRKSSRIRVLRAIEGTVGVAHSYSDILYEIPQRFKITNNLSSSSNYKLNKEIYFNPKESLGLGNVSGVGIGTTIFFSNPGVGISQIFIPTKTIYLPDHKLETGDELLYSTNTGAGISVSSNGVSSQILSDQSIVYVAKISNDLIGISTVKVGLGSTGVYVGIASTNKNISTLYFTAVGTNTYHSFKTNYPKLTGKVLKNTVTVSTAQTHGLENNDIIYINVNPNSAINFGIKYNDYNRKLLVNTYSFSSGDVNTSKNTITIANHKFVTGQKVIHNSNSPAGGLSNNKIYYIVVFDQNTIKLSASYYSSISLLPDIVDITSSSSGSLSLVNPPIKVYRDSFVTFDLSDTSLSYSEGLARYSAFELNFYKDSNLTDIYDKSELNRVFNVKKIGRVGIDPNARVTLSIDKNSPQKLFYKLDPIYANNLPTEKKEINIDSSVFSNNEIQISLSEYSGKYQIVSTSSTSFTYNLSQIPETLLYNSTDSILEYETDSLYSFGTISKIDITSKGQNYYRLPYFSHIASGLGTGALLECSSNSIGKIQRTKINDIGFDFSADYTIKPNLALPQVLKIQPLNSFDFIGISSVGRGYNTPPKLIVLDGKTKNILSEVDLYYSIGDTKVTILNNTYRLNNVEPIIIPTQNPNGVSVSYIKYNSSTKDVSVGLAVSFSVYEEFPFAVNDKILVENISVGVGSTGKGFNSENYNYQLFSITSVDANIGGIGTITYNLSNYLNENEYPGSYDPENSSGRIIPEKYFPKFSVKLKPNSFLKNEKIKYVNSNTILGSVEDWDQKTNYLLVSSRDIIENNKTIQGVSSKTQGNVLNTTYPEAFINQSAYSKFEHGWLNETGILNNNLQRIQDSFYYQNFSYSLKSKVTYDTWKDAVGSLNHTAGFKKFSDYQLEGNSNCGIKTDAISIVDVTTDIYGIGNLNCVYDFDLAKENSLNIGSKIISDEITFTSRVLTDYFESVGNRVLSIDDVSPQFNSNPRPTKFSIVNRFLLENARAQKYVTYIRDRRYIDQKQLMIFTLIHNNNVGYLNQYARVETSYDLGSFDFGIDGAEGLILFYPTKYKVNDYDVISLSCNVKDNFVGIGSTSLGGIVDINTNTFVSYSEPISIAVLDSNYTSAKIILEISGDNGQFQFDELNIIHDGTNIEFINYGQLTNHSSDAYSSSGLGTYYPYFSGSSLVVDFAPNAGMGATINTVQISIANTSVSGIETHDIKYARFSSRTTSIASTTSPTSNVISEYSSEYSGGYFIVQVTDTTNQRHQLSEVVVVNNSNDVYFTEYANLETHSTLGEIGATKSSNKTQLTFTPISNINTQVNVYFSALRVSDDDKDIVEYNNNTFETDYDVYYGTEREIKRSFELTHKNYPIFQRKFNGSDSSIVDVTKNTITIPNHFFITGEKVTYSSGVETETHLPIEISPVDFGVGIGTTDRLPNSVYIIKINDNKIKLAKNAQDALKNLPIELDFISVGIGTNHTFTSTNQNAKVVVAIDNVIQSPIVSTASTTNLTLSITSSDDILYIDQERGIFGGDLLKIDNEIMKVTSVGIGSTNAISVLRPWLGTEVVGHSTGSLITKVIGNYNIIENNINFTEPPYGKVPLTYSDSFVQEDWSGISTSSSFQGRVFMRSGIKETSNESYSKNYIFDDISLGFDGTNNTFTLTSQKNNVSDIDNENAIILINDIFQTPGLTNNYNLFENVGVTSISFVGTATSLASDINTSNLPSGGIIVSVGSTEGFGYQPLVCAGGTALVSVAGTISSVSIGNSGSGYRSAIYTNSGIKSVVVRVGVGTYSLETPDIKFIGTASISNGNVVSVAITNPGFGYTSTNPPYVIFDYPLSYSDIPLIYSSSSSGIGTQATIDVVVGQGSSVIDFEIKNTGYGYSVEEILTIPTGGVAGIPTTSNSITKEFQISVQRTFNDKFTGWSIGEIQPLDNIENFFNGKRVIFPLMYVGQLISILSAKGSNINVQDLLLVFLNDVLQVPGEGYIFTGGSTIEFTEAPKSGDNCSILFYKGSGDVDVIFRNILETVKVGDDLTLTYDSLLGQTPKLLEDPRTVMEIKSTNLVDTNPYFGPGNSTDSTLIRPLTWCKQTEDKIINEKQIGKDRMLYEPLIYPTTYLIQSVGIGSTIVYVDSVRPFFNPINESNISLNFQKKINIISQDSKVSASATAIVSIAGTISSIIINNGGFGYLDVPTVSIQNPIGIGSTTSTAIASISSGVVTSINIVGVVTGYSQSNPPVVLISPPTSKYEENEVSSYSGDFGIISGISTISIGIASTGIVFDFLIAKDSYLRNSSITGVTTISGIQTGYYFTVSNSNVGNGVTTLNNLGSIIGSGKSFIDCTYQAISVSIAQTSVIGLGLTYVAKVVASLSSYNGLTGIGYSDYYGNFSWGRVLLASRTKENSYNSYTLNGYVGLSTGTVLTRSNPLKYLNYTS